MHESNYLKNDFNNIKQLMALPCLRENTISDLSGLLKLSKLRHYAAGEYIIREGEIDAWIYFLLSGRVRIEKNGITLGQFDKPGDLFGEMRVIDGKARSASVVAVAKTICLAVDTMASHRLDSPDEMKNMVSLFYKLFSTVLSRRLRDADERLAAITSEMAQRESCSQ